MGGSFPNPAPFMYQANGTNIEQTDDNYLKLIEELKHLIPVECKDKIKSLENDERNSVFVEEVKRASENIMYRLQDLAATKM